MMDIGADDLRCRRLIELGIALSAEHNHERLMEMILLGAKELANADGGTLYLVAGQPRALVFQIMRNDTLNIAMGGTTGQPVPFPPVPLQEPDGTPNLRNVSAFAAVSGKTVNIADAYDNDHFDFSGTKRFDADTGYRSRSFLTVPLGNHNGEVTGVLQLINARAADGSIVPFPEGIAPLIEALASQAAVALNNQRLLEAQEELFRAFITMIGNAIDAKSAHTGSHCRRVPALTTLLARAADASHTGPFAAFHLSDDEWYELEVASGLHDCGKVTTPEYVADKATKLETLHNRIHEIRTRFEVVKRDAEIAYWQGLAEGGDKAALSTARRERLAQLDDDFAFVARCNVGSECLSGEDIARLSLIARTTWRRTLDDRLGLSREERRRKGGDALPLPAIETLLADKPEHLVAFERPPTADPGLGVGMTVPAHKFNRGELYNLSIRRGTLTPEERYQINDHIVQTIVMLEALPFPPNLKRVPEWAGGHHERMDGTGYPRGLTRAEMSVPARIMAIADIFEALTACDRPYKTPKKLSDAIRIMAGMAKSGHIDPDLFDLFLTSGVYRTYAEEFLRPEQIDAIDIDACRPAPKIGTK